VATTTATKRTYPWTKKFGPHSVTFRLMTPEDTESIQRTVLKFANSLPASDLVFLRMDITQPEVMDEWMHNIRIGRTKTVLAEEDDSVVGYANLHRSPLQWTRHIGEIRVLISPKFRGLGLGEALFNDLIGLAGNEGLERVVAHTPSGQPRVRAMLESLGFEAEALLTDWLMDRNNETHDLIIMSKDLSA
jgi:RimJ/RimL family protein N-acetyltransferase